MFSRNPDFHVAINLSPADLHSDQTVQLFRRVRQETGARHGSIVVEITERGFSNPQVAGTVIRDLRAAGVRVAVDDFASQGIRACRILKTKRSTT